MRDIDIPFDAAVLDLAKRLERARVVHPHWAERAQKNPYYPVEAIRVEVNELEYAIRPKFSLEPKYV